VDLEGSLVDKLRKLEALHAGTTVDGEEIVYRLPDAWTRRLFLALCRRYGLEPYRRRGQRYTTVMVRVPKTFHEKTLWPEFLALAKELEEHIAALTERVIREAIHADVGEAAESDDVKALPGGRGG
jgi:hypothetical protein